MVSWIPVLVSLTSDPAVTMAAPSGVRQGELGHELAAVTQANIINIYFKSYSVN